jgi:hypothetical protein
MTEKPIRPNMIIAHCIVCRVAFQYERGGPGRIRQTCSLACRVIRKAVHAATYRRAHPEQRSRPQAPRSRKIAKVCAVCELPFLAAVEKQQACSPACGRILAKRQGDAGRRRNSEARRRRTCENCSTEFVARNWSGQARAGKSHEGRYCSRVCAVLGRKPKCSALT